MMQEIPIQRVMWQGTGLESMKEDISGRKHSINRMTSPVSPMSALLSTSPIWSLRPADLVLPLSHHSELYL